MPHEQAERWPSRWYSPEFRAKAVALVRQRDDPAGVARDLGIQESMVREWMTQADGDQRPASAGSGSRAEHRGRASRGLLRRATSFLVRESR